MIIITKTRIPALFFLCGLFFCACSRYTERIRAEVNKPTIPILVQKPNNPAINVNLIRTFPGIYDIRAIDISLAGTTDVADISSVAVFGSDGNGMPDMSKPLCDPLPAGRKLRFNGEIRVDRDTLSLWIALTLKDKVNLDHRITVDCTGIETSEGRLQLAQPVKNPLRVGVAVRQQMQDGVHSSRIPGLATTGKGTLLAIFDARYESKRDLQGHMDIGLHRSLDRGMSWEPMQIVLDMGEWGGLPQKFNGVSDACILVDDRSDAVYVAGLWMHGLLDDNGKWVEGLGEEKTEWKHQHQWKKKASQPGFGVKQTCQFLIAKSTDDGRTWSEPVNITRQTKCREWWLFAPAPGHGITLGDGTLVFPSQGRDAEGQAFSNILWSRDSGKTWTASEPAYYGVTECMAAQLSDGTVMLNMRYGRNKGNREPNGRRVSVTSDLGRTWTEHPTSYNTLTEPTCMACLHRHDYTENGEKKSLLLFSNPNDHAVRDKITVKTSFDDGRTWPEQKWIQLDDYRGAGYSCMTSVDEQTIGILYESSQAQMVYQQIKLAEILNR